MADHHVSMYTYILAFGSNLGNRELSCHRGENHLLRLGEILRRSKLLYTKPLKSEIFQIDENQEDFLNYVIEFQSTLNPQTLYKEIRIIEDLVGHNRLRKWAPRHLDIDILFVSKNGLELSLNDEEGLCIPHPEFAKRFFLQDLVYNMRGDKI